MYSFRAGLSAGAAMPLSASGALLDPSGWRPWAGLGGNSLGGKPSASAFQAPLLRLRSLGMVLFSLGAITAVLFLLYNITRLGASGDDPRARKSALVGILVCGIALSLLGGLGALTAFFWNLF